MALERAPGALEGLADRLTVLLPWGSLLRAVALGEVDGLSRLRHLCAPGAAVEIVFGYGDSELPAAGGLSVARVVARYAEAGLEVSATKVSAGRGGGPADDLGEEAGRLRPRARLLAAQRGRSEGRSG